MINVNAVESYLPMINLKLFVVFYFSLTIFSLHAENIHWLQADFEPCHVVDKSKKIGYCDLIDKLIIDKLPEYTHSFELSTLPRYNNIMKSDREFCTTDLLRSPQRERYMLYSNTRLYILPNGLISKEGDSRLERFINENGEVQLDKLLRSELILGLNEGRVYGSGIDTLLRDATNKSPALFVEGIDEKNIHMLAMGRFDYTLGSPTEIGLFEFDEQDKNKVFFSPIEGKTELLPTHVSCRKSKLGEQIISKINQRLTAEDDKAIIQAYLSWIPQRQHEYYYNKLSAANK